MPPRAHNSMDQNAQIVIQNVGLAGAYNTPPDLAKTNLLWRPTMVDPILYQQRRKRKDGSVMLTSIIVRRTPTHAELLALFHYDPETGIFIHRRTRGKGKAGTVVGNINSQGYWEMRVFNRLFQAHQLAWFYMTGVLLEGRESPDHENGIRTDNRWGNLRLATYEQQSWNSPVFKTCKSGFKGAWPCKTTGRWQSMIQSNGKRIWLGRFDTAEDAHAAWVKAATEQRGIEWVRRAIMPMPST